MTIPQPSRELPFAGWLRDGRLRILTRVFLALALLGVGVIVGWAAGADRDLVEAEPAPTATASAPAVGADDEGAPDVRGLSLADAQQVMADSGVPAGQVTVTERPAAGQAGVIVAQDPAFGYPVVSGMTLFVSTEARVPEFADRDAEEFLDELDDLGAEVTTTSVYSPGVPVGQIASVDPKPGTVLDGPVTVVISAEADQLPLSSVEAANATCSSQVADVASGESVDSMNGTDYGDLFTCDAGQDLETQEWVVKRAATRLSGDLGIPDTAGAAGQSVQVNIVGDGTTLGTFTAAYGEVTPVDLDLTGVLRLTISYKALSGFDPDSFESVVLGMGDLVLDGDTAALATLVVQ